MRRFFWPPYSMIPSRIRTRRSRNSRKGFGVEVTGLVRELTDNKKDPKEVRKQDQIDHASTASARAKQLKIADKICNVEEVVASPPPDWSVERRREYLDWAERVVAGCRGVNEGLEARFDAALAQARRALSVGGMTGLSSLEHLRARAPGGRHGG